MVILKLTLTFSVIIVFHFQLSSTNGFDQKYTGVVYSAYVKRAEDGKEIPDWKTYSLNDIKTMLEVVATRFSNVATYGVGADNVRYEWNKTYHLSNKQVYAAEAAALINKERNAPVLKVIVGLWQSDITLQMETEIRLAFESAKIANDIYPDTVTALVFSNGNIAKDFKQARQTLNNIRNYKDQASKLGYKIGSRQNCLDITTVESGKAEEDIINADRRRIVNESDFIICQIEPAGHNLPSGAKAGFVTVKNDLIGFRDELTQLNPNLHVMGETSWPSKGSENWQNIDNLRIYWESVNEWAVDNNFTMWLGEAFDNPWKKWDAKSANLGWWKLRENRLVGDRNGYAEKMFEPPEEEVSIGLNPWAYVGIGLGVLLVLFVLTLITLLFLRVNKLQEVVTKEDVSEFMHGISDDVALQQGSSTDFETALKFPYDKTYEISKEKLKINRDHLLGSGNFGCVYTAIIDNKEKTEVALKMAKSGCPKNALKSLLSEIKILLYIGKHPNIVSIHGAYTAEILNGIVYVATELCTLGSLEGYLRKTETLSLSNETSSRDRYANAPTLYANEIELTEKPEITFMDMTRWAHDIACGMEYLGCKHVVHADLSTRNVLLTADKTAKITDFGLSRRLYDYTNYVKKQQEPLPWRWMAIESLKRLEFSDRSDVWSFGVTLWEIYALGDLPYPGLSWNLDFVDSLVNGLRMKCPPHASPAVYNIMVDCWHTEPKDRPTFTSLKHSLSEIMEASIGSKME